MADIKSVGYFASQFQKTALEAGSKSGFDMVAGGAAVGAGVGGIQGSFSDYGGFFGGATKGALAGAVGATGVKYAGSKYAKGYTNAFGEFDATARYSDKQLHNLVSPKVSHFTGGKFDEGEDWFGTQYQAFGEHKKVGKFLSGE